MKSLSCPLWLSGPRDLQQHHFALPSFHFSFDKVDETIIFVIGQSSRNVRVGAFLQVDSLGWGSKPVVKHAQECSPPLSLSLVCDYELPKMDWVSRWTVWVLYHCGKKSFQEKGKLLTEQSLEFCGLFSGELLIFVFCTCLGCVLAHTIFLHLSVGNHTCIFLHYKRYLMCIYHN